MNNQWNPTLLALTALGGATFLYYQLQQYRGDINPKVKYIRARRSISRKRKEFYIELNNKRLWVYQRGVYWHYVSNDRRCTPSISLAISELLQRVS